MAPVAARSQSAAPDGAHAAPEVPDNETELAILEAGSACLARFGNEKTSIQDVAYAAGLSRATIYRYFPDRATLLRAVTRHEQARLLQEVRSRAATTRSLEDALTIVVEVLAASARRFRTQEHLGNRDRGLAQYLLLERRDELQPLRELVAPYVERAYEAGELERDLEPEAAIEWIVFMLSMIPALPRSEVVDVDDPAVVGQFFARRLCRGLVPRRARRSRR